jgi:small subunit ribosomal protein S6e
MSDESLYKLNVSGGKKGAGKGATKVIQLQKIDSLVGKKIGEEVDGGLIGFPGYILKITGGSDSSGIPMRFDVHGPVKKRILLMKGPCYKVKRAGNKRRKVVRGNEITDDMKQINMVVVKYGRTKLFQEAESDEKKE